MVEDPLVERGSVTWLPPWQSVSHSNRDQTHSVAAWYRSEGVNPCTYEVCSKCTVGPHSVIGNEVTEVRCAGGEGRGSLVSLLIATYIT